uniref:glycosyl hydrolase family 95 catalytic domain-containing protein n=1 Tax=uncultured Draconibacterium sp. TaxID=1573823 RepID=UPI003217D17A
MKGTKIFTLVLVLAISGFFSFAQKKAFVGATATQLAREWTRAMLTGNGNMGGIMFGDPYAETIIINHCKLYLPMGSREIVPNLGGDMSKLKKTGLEAGINSPAIVHKKVLEKTGHKIVNTDPFHPAFFLKMNMKPDSASNYLLTENFETGEIVAKWSDREGEWQRKLFISRADDVAVMTLKGPCGKVNCNFQMEINHELIETSIVTEKGFISAHNVYKKGKGGYDCAIRIITDKGTVIPTADGVSVENADEIVLLMQVRTWRTPIPKELSESWAFSPQNPAFSSGYKTNYLAEIKTHLRSLSDSYENLLKPHVKLHSELFSRVKLNLGATDTDRQKPTEQLLTEAAVKNQTSLALMERIYDACRYLTICSSGTHPSNLQGIWTGTWSPAWSGDYTVDSNLQLEIQSLMSCNMPELMNSFFNLVDSWLPDCRLNAKKFYGCRGAVSNARASSVCLLLHWGQWPGEQLISCLGWLAHFYYDYYQFTGDREFLKNRAVPLMKEVALFYEDLLAGTEDENGKFRFFISYSPEHKLWANSTFDIAVAKAIYTYLIKACSELHIENGQIKKWKKLRDKLPSYLLNSHGGLQEWAWKGADEDYNQRHHSHFLPLYQFCEFDPERTPELWKASQIAFDDKVNGWFRLAQGSNSNHITHGMVNQGQCAARLGRSDIVYETLDRMAARKYIYPSFMMSYWPGYKGFGFDPVGCIPDNINNALAFMWEKTLDVLPALPEQWPKGSLEGILLRNQVKLDRLAWNKLGKYIEIALTSEIEQNITMRFPLGCMVDFIAINDFSVKVLKLPERENCYDICLPEKRKINLKIKLK